MTNNQLCNFLSVVGCLIASFCMGLMFFGATVAVWGAIVGICVCVLGLANYER